LIFVSSSCIKEKYIADVVKLLAESGFNNIELSGGTKCYPEILNDLKKLKKIYNLEYNIHNYFPPPEDDFVFNLASTEYKTYDLSLQHAYSAIKLSKDLNTRKVSFHSGFFIELTSSELGQLIAKDIRRIGKIKFL